MKLKKIIWHDNIQFRLSAILIFVTTLILVGFAVYNHNTAKAKMESELSYMSQMASTRLAKNLVSPLWEMEDDLVAEILATEMKEKQILALLVKDKEGQAITFGKVRNEKWEPVDTDQDITQTFIVSRAKIIKEEDSLGTVEIHLTDRFMREELTRSIINTAITVAILNFAILISLIISIKRIFIRPIHRIADTLNQGSKQVATSANQVSGSSQSLADGASQQAASLEETSASLEEMSAMTKQNADNVVQADTFMKEANHVVGQTNESMADLTRSMDEISTASQETSKIIKTIDEIAFQTNLLALNAAVEAARAGEAGAGFAVVADEVRNLALRAAEAAKSTATLIEGTVQKISDGSQLVNKSNDAFSRVADSTSKVGKLLGEIAVVSKEQAQGIDQVSRTVADMDRVVQQSAANTEESAAASQELDSQAVQMKQSVDGLVGLVGGSRKNAAQKRSAAGRTANSAHPQSDPPATRKAVVPQAKKEVTPEEIIPLKDDDFQDF